MPRADSQRPEPTPRRADRRVVRVGALALGGGAPILVQSMTTTDTERVEPTVAQAERLADVGCEIVRLAVPTLAAAETLRTIRQRVRPSLPLVADIHYDPRIALAAVAAGIDKLRLNPGNISDPDQVARIVDAAGGAGIPIRVGANSGSLADRFLVDGRPTAVGLADSALEEVHLLERRGFEQIVISVKGTDVPMTIEATRSVARAVEYPLHVGITEAGTIWEGGLRSAVGIGVLLADGLGDTIRVSLAGDPIAEVRAAYAILRSLHLRERGILWRVCPTCGRTRIGLPRIAESLQADLADVQEPLTVALMGCPVNGIGEARDADIGLVGGDRSGTVYVEGEPVARSIPEKSLIAELVTRVRALAAEQSTEGRSAGVGAESGTEAKDSRR